MNGTPRSHSDEVLTKSLTDIIHISKIITRLHLPKGLLLFECLTLPEAQSTIA